MRDPVKMRHHRKQWVLRNREKVNAKRRALRLRKKLQSVAGRHCLLCEILLTERCKGVRVYCRSCVDNYPKEVSRHKWRRYYYRKKGLRVKEQKERDTKYVVSWKTLKRGFA
jgi:hypothetical protein